MGKSEVKGKVVNLDSPAKEDSRTTDFDDEDNGAVNQTELAKDATTTTTDDADPSLASILTAIGTLKEDITSRFNGLDSNLHSIQSSLTDHATRIADIEGAVTDHDTRLTDLEWHCAIAPNYHQNPSLPRKRKNTQPRPPPLSLAIRWKLDQYLPRLCT